MTAAPAKTAGPAGLLGAGLLLIGLLGAVTLASYWPVTGNDFINADDDTYITANRVVREGLTARGVLWALGATAGGTWHPLTWMSHMLDVQAFGLDAGKHHLTSLLLHLGSTLLLFAVLRRMTGALWRSLAVALLFALHPLHVESVAWAAERKDVLSVFLGLLAAVAYLRHAERPRPARRFLVCLAFALALLAKPMLVTLPFVFLLLDYWPLGRLRAVSLRSPAPGPPPGSAGIGRLLAEKLPLFSLSLAASLVAVWAQHRERALVSLADLPFGARIANALAAHAGYLRKFVWPSDLAIFYPHPGGGLGLPVAAGALFALLAIGAVLAARRCPAVTVGWFWFVGSLVPVIGLAQVGAQSMADRYAYFPSIGIFVALVWPAAAGVERRPSLRPAAALGLVALCGTLAVLTRAQVGTWRDSRSVFTHAAAVTKDNWAAHLNLGNALLAERSYQAALAEYTLALRARPDHADISYNIGNVLYRLGRVEEAAERYRAALLLDPAFAKAWFNLGIARAALGRRDEALAAYRRAVQLSPDFAEARNNLAVALAEQGRFDEAFEQYGEAIRLDPGYAEPYYNAGVDLEALGRRDEAIERYRAALRIRPDHPQALARLGRLLTSRSPAGRAP